MVYKVYIGTYLEYATHCEVLTDLQCMMLLAFTGNLPGGTSEAEIEREFARFGTLATVWVARKPAGFGESHHIKALHQYARVAWICNAVAALVY